MCLVRPVIDRLLPEGVVEVNLDNLSTNRNKIREETKMFLITSFSGCLSLLVTRPFTVITTRSIAQHVGQETMYSSVLQAVRQIYSEEGVAGFYSGLVPAMLEWVMTILINHVAAVIIFEAAKLMPSRIPPVLIMAGDWCMSYYLAWICSHPLGLVSTLMAVNDSGLAAATVRFSDWRDCWNHLRVTDNLFRGIWVSRILFKSAQLTSVKVSSP